MVAGLPFRADGLTALVDKDKGAHFLGRFPEGPEFRLVKGFAVHLVANHGSLETQLQHGPLQFGDGGRGILHREDSQAGQPLGVVQGHLADFVVAVPGDGGGNGRILVILIKAGGGGDHLNIHAQGVHIGDALFRRPGIAGIEKFPVGGGHAVPILAGQDGPLKALGSGMGVNVDATHWVSFPGAGSVGPSLNKFRMGGLKAGVRCPAAAPYFCRGWPLFPP